MGPPATKPSMSPSVSSLPTFSTELLTFPPSPATPPTESLDTLPSPVLATPESPVLPATTNDFGHQNLGCVSLATTHLFMWKLFSVQKAHFPSMSDLATRSLHL